MRVDAARGNSRGGRVGRVGGGFPACEWLTAYPALALGGEWTAKAAAEGGMKIICNVVRMGRACQGGRKMICLGATIAHCEELCRQFNAAGINFRLWPPAVGGPGSRCDWGSIPIYLM